MKYPHQTRAGYLGLGEQLSEDQTPSPSWVESGIVALSGRPVIAVVVAVVVVGGVVPIGSYLSMFK